MTHPAGAGCRGWQHRPPKLPEANGVQHASDQRCPIAWLPALHACTHTHMHSRVCNAFTHTHALKCVTQTLMHVCTYTHSHMSQTHTRAHIHSHTHTHTLTCTHTGGTQLPFRRRRETETDEGEERKSPPRDPRTPDTRGQSDQSQGNF